MTALRGTKRRLDLESASPEPAETLTTDGSFLTAESNFGEDHHDDMTEVSSPAKPGKLRKWSKKTEELKEDAATFAKARTLLKHAGPTRAGPSQREQRAQLRAQRLEQKTARAHHAEEEDDILHDADANELEAAASLVDLMAHEALHMTGNDDGSQAMSQDTGSSADRAFAAAWARVHGNDASDAAAPSRLTTAWQAQHETSGGDLQLQSPPANRWSPEHQATIQAQAQANEDEPGMTTAQQPVEMVQPSLAAVQSPLRADTVVTPLRHTHMAEAEAMHAPQEGQMFGADDHVQEGHPPVVASPLAAAAPQQPGKSVASSMPRGVQQGQPAVHSSAIGDKAGSPAASLGGSRPTTAVQAALGGRTPASGAGTHLAGVAAAAATANNEQTKAARDSAELEARAMQIAMQRLVAREAEEKKQDEAWMQSCPSSSLVHIPLWGSSLSPEAPGQLQGSLAVPATCSVRLLRRIFARAVQVQPSCVQLVMPQTGTALQDFIAGQEASIRQHGLDGAAGREGLQVQLQLQEGCARVEALIQQEVHLVKQELLSARLRSPAQVKSTGPSARSPAGPSVTAVLQSAGWGTTSPAKRIPKALPANEGGRQLADYEAMLPAGQGHSPGAPVISPGRRKVGRWSQEEVAMLITKMEAGHFWAKIRNEWPKLGFPKRSDVDLKDKWRNLEDAVVRGRPTRTVRLTQDQMERIHRCHRKYRAMQASASPSGLRSPPKEQPGASDRDSMPKKQAPDKSSDLYEPTQQTSSDDGDNAANHNTSPMVTRSKAHRS